MKVLTFLVATLLSVAFLMPSPKAADKPDVPMPAAIVLILCKTVPGSGPPDPNAKFTGHEGREWAIEHSKMVCRRNEVPLYDIAADQGADARPFTTNDCLRAGLMLGVGWNMQHKSSPYRFWRFACPTPIRSGPKSSDPIVGWKLPDCGHRDTVHCEVDTMI